MDIVQDKSLYLQINIEYQSTTPLFYLYQWLDQVCGTDQWLPYILKDNGVPKAIFPIYTKCKWGVAGLVMPLLTPYLSMHILREEDHVHYGSYLKKFDNVFSYNFMAALSSHYNYTPYVAHWQQLGYAVAWRNTHIFKAQPYHQIRSHYKKQLARDINNANKVLTIEVQKHGHDLYPLVCETFGHQKLAPPVTKSFLCGIIDLLPQHNFVLTAKLGDKAVASILILNDGLSYYYILSGRSMSAPRGSVALLLDRAIEMAMDKGLTFDFEGSSIESIAVFFKSFNPQHHHFIHAIKYKSSLMKAIYERIRR